MANYILRVLQIAQMDYFRIKQEECVKKVNVLYEQVLGLRQKQMDAISASAGSAASSSTSSSTNYIQQTLKAEHNGTVIDADVLYKIDIKLGIFGYIEMLRSHSYQGKIHRALAIDLDDTLIKNKLTPAIEYIFLDQWLKMFENLPEGVAAIAVTSRMCPDLNVHSAEEIISGLEKKVGKKIFHSIMYTSGGSKISALESIYEKYFAFEEGNNARTNVGIVDDKPENVNSAIAAGFCGFYAKADNTDHFNQMAEFIKPFIAEEKIEQAQNLDTGAMESHQPMRLFK